MNLTELPRYTRRDLPRQVAAALEEDVGSGDLTALLIPADRQGEAALLTREEAVLCGSAWVDEVFRQLGGGVRLEWLRRDGDLLAAGETFCRFRGNARRILTGERTALNFLQTLMGTATVTRTHLRAVTGKNITLLDTRKTLPGLRTAQKYAVLCGGGSNHRLALYDAFLVKENHIAACGSITAAVERARKLAADRRIIVEVETLEELDEAIRTAPDQIMLDNFSATMVNTALTKVPEDILLELSGDFDLARLDALDPFPRPVAVSIGALTKHLVAVDLSLRLS